MALFLGSAVGWDDGGDGRVLTSCSGLTWAAARGAGQGGSMPGVLRRL